MSRLLSLFYFLMTFQAELFLLEAADISKHKPTSVNWIKDLPNYDVDLKEYKHSLNNILLYFKDFKSDMNLNAVFGLRLIRENFKHSLANMGTKLSLADRSYINGVIDRANNLIQYFKKYPPESLRPMEKNVAAVATATDRPWWQRLKQYDMDPFKLQVERPMTLSWEQYNVVSGAEAKMVPSSLLTDFCMNWLADDTSYVRSTFPQSCRMPPDCMTALLKGTDFGVALGYRILLIVFANVGKNCKIIARKDDTKMIKKLCELAMRDIKYIVDHNYGAPAMILEHTFLCTTQGYTQFMNRSWLRRPLQLQTSHGCFMESFDQPIAPGSRNIDRRYVRGDRDEVDKCDVTTTAIAAATLAAAIRFILESYN